MPFALLALAGCGGPGSAFVPTGSTSHTGEPLQADDPRVVASGPAVCADPGARAAGPLERTVIGSDWATTGDLTSGGRGVVVADFDGDGHLDLFVPRFAFVSRVLFGDGRGGFEDRTDDALPGGLTDAFGGSAADPDGDGDLDILVYRARSDVVMLVNDGSGRFDPQLHPEWEPDTAGCGGAAAAADADLDGDLDVFYGRLGLNDGSTQPPTYRPCVSTYLLGNGDGTFVDASDQLSEDVQHLRVMAAGWHEVDGDPWPELYVTTDLPEVLEGNRLLDNGPGGLVQLLGTGLEADLASMGLAAGDLNDDGVPDFVVPGVAELAVLQSSASPGLWVDYAQSLGVVPDRGSGQEVGWGGELVDLDNDGLLDLPMGYGTIPYSSIGPQPDEIYRNLGGSFERVGAAWGFDDETSTRGFVVADLDRDGWLDIVKRDIGGPVTVFRSRCGASHWLQVKLRGPAPNVFAVGARVEIDVGGRTLWRGVYAGSTSYNSGGPPEVHFGLGEADRVDALRVVWPTGEVTHHPGQAADRWLEVTYSPD